MCNIKDLRIKRYYNKNVEPIFLEIKCFINELDGGVEKELIAISWSSFYRNSIALFELLNKTNLTDQFAMTLRLLMENSADVNFVKEYPNNITSLVKSVNKAARKLDNNKTFADAAKIARDIYLLDSLGKAVGPEERVEKVYKESRFEKLYDYYCCYTHFNILATIWTAKRIQMGDATIAAHSMYLMGFYPDMFEKLIKAYGEIANSDKLREYNFEKMREVIKVLIVSNKGPGW